MPPLEIEGKYHVSSHQHIRERLRILHNPLIETEEQRDVYYTHPIKDFRETDEALRVRYTGTHYVLTYKGPRHATTGLKSREEVNIIVDSGEAVEKILQCLGFTPSYTVWKKRERYGKPGIDISLDEVQGLGTFVEIESKGAREDAEKVIEKIKKELRITGEHIPLSYLELLISIDPSVRSGSLSPRH